MTGRLARAYPERSTAMLRGFGRSLDRATLVGGAVAAASSGVLSVALGSSVSLLLAPIVAAVFGALLGTAVARLLIPKGLLQAFEAYSWLGRAEMDRFVARTGGNVPVKRPDMERWLDMHPPTPAFRLSRIEILAFVGRLDEARAELEDVVATSPDLAFERASLVQYIGWLTDGDPRLVELRATLGELALDDEERRAADVTLAIAEGRDRFVHADPGWSRPLEDVRPSLGGAPSRVVLRDTWRPMTVVYLFVGLVVGSFGSLLGALP